MVPDLTAIEWVSVSSLSLSLAALLARFLTKVDKVSAKAHLLTAVAVLAILSAVVASAHSFKKASDIAALSAQIYAALGNQQKTTDQLIVELGLQKELNFSAALETLREKHAIESEVGQTPILGRPNAVRVWRALAAP